MPILADGGTGTVPFRVCSMDQTGVGGSIFNLGANQAIALAHRRGQLLRSMSAAAIRLTIGSAAGSTTFAGTITGMSHNSFLIKDGASTEILTGTSTFTGRTEVVAGVLQIGNGTTSGSIATSTPVVVDAAVHWPSTRRTWAPSPTT